MQIACDQVVIKVVAESQDLLPVYATTGSAGADLKANVKEPVSIAPGAIRIIPTGIKLEIPQGYEVQIRPRSGLAAKSGITVLNTPGTIDSDYRGEIQVILINLSEKEPFTVTYGMRIAQMCLSQSLQCQFICTEQLSTSERGSGGFGHTGIH